MTGIIHEAELSVGGDNKARAKPPGFHRVSNNTKIEGWLCGGIYAQASKKNLRANRLLMA